MRASTPLLSALLLIAAARVVTGRRGSLLSEDKVPVNAEALVPATHWRFITAEWPLSAPDNTTWGYAEIRAYPSKKCKGEFIVPEDVYEGGGNWTNGIHTDSDDYDYLEYDYEDYEPKQADEDYWFNGAEEEEGKRDDGGSADDVEEGSEDDEGSADDGDVADGSEDDGSGSESGGSYDSDYGDGEDYGDTYFTSTLGTWALFKFMPAMSCKDTTTKKIERVPGYAACHKACVEQPNCRAFTYNIETKVCYLKAVCLHLRKDTSSNDISGIFLRDTVRAAEEDLDAGAEGADEDGSGGEAEGATEGTDEDETYKYVKNWEEESKTIKDSPLGGAFVELKLSQPELIRCMQIIVPPRLKAQFPQAGRIQFSLNGLDWFTAQALEPIGQESLLVKTLTGHAEQQYLETRGEKFPPPPSPITEESYVPKKTLAEAVAAAMNAARASVDKGVHFNNVITGISFVLGMMAIGAVLSCCVMRCCCRRRNNKRELSYSDSLNNGELNSLSALEMMPSETADKQI